MQLFDIAKVYEDCHQLSKEYAERIRRTGSLVKDADPFSVMLAELAYQTGYLAAVNACQAGKYQYEIPQQ